MSTHLLPLRRLWIAFAASLALIAAVAGPSADGQVLYGTLTGNIVDPAGASIPSVTVSVLNEGTGQVRETTANSSGTYSFQDLLAGTYTVTTKMPGFQTNIQHAIVLTANNQLRLDVSLHPGGMSETVTVDGTPPALQTDRTDVRTELSTVTLENAPVRWAGTTRTCCASFRECPFRVAEQSADQTLPALSP